MSTGPHRSTSSRAAARPPDQTELRRLIRTGAVAAGEPPAVDHSRSRSRRVARSDRRRLRQLAAEGVSSSSGVRPGRRAVASRAARTRRRAGRARRLARFNLRPDLPDLALFPGRTGSRRAAPRCPAADTDLAYGEPFARRATARLAVFLGGTRGTVGTHHNLGIHAGSTQALFTSQCLALERREANRRRGPQPPLAHRDAGGVGSRARAGTVDRGLCVDALADLDAVVVSPSTASRSASRFRPGAGVRSSVGDPPAR
jgi:hypothetical protein